MRHGRRHRPAVGLILAASLAVTVAAAADASSGDACTGKAPEAPSTIVLPPGSHQLARAIDSVAPGGTIVLQAGRHSESRGVVIDKPLALLGLPGAELEVRTSPSTGYPLRVDPALTIRRTSHVQVRGLTLLPRRSLGGAAILIDGSEAVTVADNRLLDHQFGVVVQRATGAEITRNAIVAGRRAPGPTPPETYGILVVNGRDARLDRNTIADATYGIWASDRDGRATGNVVLGSLGGIALGRIPALRFRIAGDSAGSATTASGWTVRGNLSSGNAHGFLLRDGASGIDLADNISSATGLYDVEVACPEARYGFVTLDSFKEWVSREGQGELAAQGCGVGPLLGRVAAPGSSARSATGRLGS